MILTYKGQILTSGSATATVWQMRENFHRQLQKLWGKEPYAFLKEWEDSGFHAGAPNFQVSRGSRTFVPFLGSSTSTAAEIDITLLTGAPEQKKLISGGDLDNRVKRVIDALTVPQAPNQIPSSIPKDSRWYCLLENDNVVYDLKVSLGTFLESDDPRECFVLIRAKPVLTKATFENISLLSWSD